MWKTKYISALDTKGTTYLIVLHFIKMWVILFISVIIFFLHYLIFCSRVSSLVSKRMLVLFLYMIRVIAKYYSHTMWCCFDFAVVCSTNNDAYNNSEYEKTIQVAYNFSTFTLKMNWNYDFEPHFFIFIPPISNR